MQSSQDTVPSRRSARRSARSVTAALGGLGALALVAGAAVGTASHAAAAPTTSVRVTCAQAGVITDPGARVSYRATCQAARMTVSGVITDMADDGRCVRVTVTIGATRTAIRPVCGIGQSAAYSVEGPVTVASIMTTVG